jgi:RNA recognition motif-containing protein
LFIENLERNITESKLEEIFKRYGTIEERKQNKNNPLQIKYILFS